MMLRRKNWSKILLQSVCDKPNTINIRNQSGKFNYIDIGSINSDFKRVAEVQTLDWSNASSRARQIVKKGDVLFSTVRVNLERIAFLDKEIPDAIASTGFTVIRAKEGAYAPYIFYAISSPKFIAKVAQLQKGTAYPAVSDKIVLSQKIPFPSLPEQKQIASLFNSLEVGIEEVDRQIKKVKALQKRLNNGLNSEVPSFGNLVSTNNCTPVTFNLIANCIEKHDKNKFNFTRFLGLDDIEPESLKIKSWGNLEEGTTFTKTFLKGDVLFGKRRAYLKKVAVADFDGICSGDILVFRANEKLMLPELLPFYVSSDVFINHAINTSAGSLSPRTKWKDLAALKLSIPDIKTQEKILEVLKQLLKTIEGLQLQKVNLQKLKLKLFNEILGEE
jgi:type I restriction enzyme, S subunit